MIRFSLHALLMLAAITCASFAKADVINYLSSCSSTNPDKKYQSIGLTADQQFTDLIDIKGPVKRVLRKWQDSQSDKNVTGNRYDDNTEFLFDRSGRLTLSRRIGEREQTYSYDAEGRISQIAWNVKDENKKEPGFKPFRKDSFSYYKEKNMVVVKSTFQPELGFGWGTREATIRSTEPSGEEVCYYLTTSRNGSEGWKYVLSPNKSKYTKLNRSVLQNIFLPPKTEKDADIVMLAMLKDLQTVSVEVCGHGNYSDDNHWECSYNEKNNDSGFDKFTKSHDGYLNKKTWSEDQWYDESFLVEEVGTDSDKLADGSRQHKVYKYEFDDHGNWIRRDVLVNEPATLTNDKATLRKIGAITRKIEYYN